MLLESKLQPYVVLTFQMAINDDVQTVLKNNGYPAYETYSSISNISDVIGELMYLSYNEDLISITINGNGKNYVFGQYDSELEQNNEVIYENLKNTENEYLIIDTKKYSFLSGRSTNCIGIARMIKDIVGNELGMLLY